MTATADELKFLCSDRTSTSGVDVCGTGIATSKIFLIDYREPWPSDINLTDLWEETKGIRSEQFFRRSRYLLTKPKSETTRLQCFIRNGNATEQRNITLNEGETYSDGLRRLENTDSTQYNGPSTLLICGHDARDKCCGTKGSALAAELSDTDIQIEVVSHTAGHRFAPTMIDMPTGDSWAFVDVGLAQRVANSKATTADYQRNFRGWWGAKAGAEQMAIRHLRTHSSEPITEITNDENITVTTADGTQHVYSVSEVGKEAIPQCEVEDGGTLKYRKLYSVEPVS